MGNPQRPRNTLRSPLKGANLTNEEKKQIAFYLKNPDQMARSADSQRKAKEKHERKVKELARTRAAAGDAFLQRGFNDQVLEVVRFIDSLKPNVGCKKAIPNKRSFEFIRCGFQKFILEHDATKLKQFGVPTKLDQIR
jgi:hypothetical protein